MIPVSGGEARQVTTIGTEASSAVWSNDGRKIAFVSSVWPEYSDKPFAQSDELNRKRKEDAEKSPVKAKVFNRLLPALGRVCGGQAPAPFRLLV